MPSGKYATAVPEGSRLALSGYEWLKRQVLSPESVKASVELASSRPEIGATASQLAIAWVRAGQAREHRHYGGEPARAGRGEHEGDRFPPKLTPEFLERVDAAVNPAKGFVGT